MGGYLIELMAEAVHQQRAVALVVLGQPDLGVGEITDLVDHLAARADELTNGITRHINLHHTLRMRIHRG